jgi:uncharacterized protein involved in tolerance to divalent cations
MKNLEMVACLLRSGECESKEAALKVIQERLNVTRNNAFVYFTKAKKLLEEKKEGHLVPKSSNEKVEKSMTEVVEDHKKVVALTMKPTDTGSKRSTRYA